MSTLKFKLQNSKQFVSYCNSKDNNEAWHILGTLIFVRFPFVSCVDFGMSLNLR